MSTLTVTTVNTANGTTDHTIATGNTTGGKIVIPATGGVVLAGNSSVNAITVDSGGNVGIGTSSPGTKFHVNGPAWIGGASNTTSAVAIYTQDATSASIEALDPTNYTIKRNIGIAAFGGNVGIGTQSPSTKLDVNGSITNKGGTGGSVGYVTLVQGGSAAQGGYMETRAGNGTRIGFNGWYDGTNYYGSWTDGATPILIGTNGITRAAIDASGNFQFNSGYGSSATAYGCRAWAAYNGQTPALLANGGITSVTRSAAGVYTFNLSFTMPDANYSVTIGMGDISGVGNEHHVLSSITTTAFTVSTSLSNDTWADSGRVNVAVFR